MEFRTEIVEAFPKMRRWAMQMTRCSSARDDLVQDTIERALRGEATFTPGTNLDGWLYRIMRNSFVSQVRRASREIVVDPGDLTFANLSVAPCQEDALRMRDIKVTFDGMTENHRVALQFAVAGVPMQKAAEVQGIAEGTAKSRLARARAVMQARVA